MNVWSILTQINKSKANTENKFYDKVTQLCQRYVFTVSSVTAADVDDDKITCCERTLGYTDLSQVKCPSSACLCFYVRLIILMCLSFVASQESSESANTTIEDEDVRGRKVQTWTPLLWAGRLAHTSLKLFPVKFLCHSFRSPLFFPFGCLSCFSQKLFWQHR